MHGGSAWQTLSSQRSDTQVYVRGSEPALDVDGEDGARCFFTASLEFRHGSVSLASAIQSIYSITAVTVKPTFPPAREQFSKSAPLQQNRSWCKPGSGAIFSCRLPLSCTSGTPRHAWGCAWRVRPRRMHTVTHIQPLPGFESGQVPASLRRPPCHGRGIAELQLVLPADYAPWPNTQLRLTLCSIPALFFLSGMRTRMLSTGAPSIVGQAIKASAC